ncbi:hypothetical protein FIBSPDRAFT_1038330 [Athelia psychrophila]|uniref:Uncharacterized protein n=1 Tax=Athelia psychrophila TaxID=1759441 RepID=A0A166T891_9AGAM|nr:hypothetical protein FIBSPDRAFT_1038330 [Fibularhizoctonia sp. CBS 109695]
MKLRSYTNTVPVTAEELIESVYPDQLDASFSWHAKVGERVWVKVDNRWKPGVVVEDIGCIATYEGFGRCFMIEWGARKKYQASFYPTNGNVKPDYVAVRNALLNAGYDVVHAS